MKVRILLSILLSILTLFAAVFIVGALWSPSVVGWIESLSAAIAVIDDLLLRIFGTIALVIGAAGFVVWGLTLLSEGKDPKDRALDLSQHFWLLIKLGAAVGISGSAFFASYKLDDFDKDAEGILGWSGGGSKTTMSVPAPNGANMATILARWIQVFGPDSCRVGPRTDTLPESNVNDCAPRFLLRVVIPSNESCSTVAVNFSRRARTGAKPKPAQLTERSMTNSEKFSEFLDVIEVCETEIADPFSIERIRFDDGRQIRGPTEWAKKGSPRRIAFVGDTGCRDSSNQACTRNAWPFEQLARSIRAESPDLLIHLGDLMYVKSDTWDAWKDYVFNPAKPLLEAAPWIVVRGNHERCGDHGQAPKGFYLFFGHDDDKDCDNDNELTSTFAVDLSPENRLIVLDSSIAFETDRDPDFDTCDEPCAALRNGLAAVRELAKDEKTIWLATHVPPFALEWKEEKDPRKRPVIRNDGGLKVKKPPVFPKSSAMMLGLWRQQPLKSIDVVFAGDRHLLQTLKGEGGRPYQVTVGTGGVNLDGTPSAKGTEHLSAPPKSQGWLNIADKIESCSYVGFGYLMTEVQNGKYSMAFHTVGQGDPRSPTPCDAHLP